VRSLREAGQAVQAKCIALPLLGQPEEAEAHFHVVNHTHHDPLGLVEGQRMEANDLDCNHGVALEERPKGRELEPIDAVSGATPADTEPSNGPNDNVPRSTRMRAAVITKFNQPWEIQSVPDPSPHPGQVLVRVLASGMCGTDLHVYHGMFPIPTPFVAGHEPVGEILEVGAGVTDLRVGDRVGVHWFQKGCGRCAMCLTGQVNGCESAQTWMNLGGGNGELMVAWASGCMLLPDGLDAELAAPIFCAGYTVMSGLRSADPKPGERAAILGVGGLGHLALQYARAVGLETVAITGQESKRGDLKAMGADDVVVATPETTGQALKAAGGADIILSTTGSSQQVSAALSGLRRGGRLVNMGVTDGPIVVDPMVLMFGRRQLRGSSQEARSDLYEALQLVARGKVKPAIEVYPLEQINTVRERLEAGKVRFRAVMTPRQGV
jgi:2-desacetyl-2-hydroxyethyl bacteriochlorophyllide A dehydrogenase